MTSPLLNKAGRFVVDESAGLAVVTAALFEERRKPLAVVATTLYSAEKVYTSLLDFLDEKDVVYFPADELLRAEAVTSGKEFLSQRLYALSRLMDPSPKILVTHPAALLRFQSNPAVFKDSSLSLKVGQKLDMGKLKNLLTELGYTRVDKIDQSLQFAARGDIVDFFSVSEEAPIRVEFFDDEIESIRYFDIATQTSKKAIKEAMVLPGSDIVLSNEEIEDFAKRMTALSTADAASMKEDTAREYLARVNEAIAAIVERKPDPKLYKYFGFAVKKAYSVLDYFNPEAVYVADRTRFNQSVANLLTEASHYYNELRERYLIPTGLAQYMTVDEAFKSHHVLYGERFAKGSGDNVIDLRPIVPAGKGLTGLSATIKSYSNPEFTTLLSLPQPHEREVTEGILKENEIPYMNIKGDDVPSEPGVYITERSFSQGFESLSLKLNVLSSFELFGRQGGGKRVKSRFKEATVLRSYEDLHPGDYVVHEYNGIGQFLGVTTIETEGKHRDYLEIIYADDNKLYVPLEQFRLVRKYAGREGAAPRLSRLYSKDWEKRKAKIKEKVNELAERLMALYSERAKIEGYAFPPDTERQKRFESEFPHELTEDQYRSLKEIKEDMEAPVAMDRLLCGDVGFGKTEVAFRAAFKALEAGKQVALLCPTTLLARQHYEVALERFHGYYGDIAHLSRLVPPARQKALIKGIKEGKIRFVIGTHRLLSKEVQFQDLGLLIVDEEQRFGVEQKEKIKELKHNVDVLSLSATPIPRTLQMSLLGIRPLSEINTAPSERTPVETYVAPYNEDIAVELISREIARRGQAYYIHNNIDSIYQKAASLSRLLPGASYGVVHGKMDKSEVEDVMEDFYDGKIDVLVATSIIENGIDVPNANLLIVEDADRFGLSQLYQIKGRVGRSDRMAYAYLFYRPEKDMNEDAVKRLQAIQEFTELGSGYKIAQRDLLIRGAGDILGPEQAGFIDSIGLDLYLKLLNEAIEERKTGLQKEAVKPVQVFDIDAYIPPSYASEQERIALYQELDGAKTLKDLRAIVAKMKDAHGRMPKEVELLVEKKKIDILVSRPAFEALEEGPTYVDVVLSRGFSDISGIGNDLFSALVPYLSRVKVTYIDRKLKIRYVKGDGWLKELQKILSAVEELYEAKKPSP